MLDNALGKKTGLERCLIIFLRLGRRHELERSFKAYGWNVETKQQLLKKSREPLLFRKTSTFFATQRAEVLEKTREYFFSSDVGRT